MYIYTYPVMFDTCCQDWNMNTSTNRPSHNIRTALCSGTSVRIQLCIANRAPSPQKQQKRKTSPWGLGPSAGPGGGFARASRATAGAYIYNIYIN